MDRGMEIDHANIGKYIQMGEDNETVTNGQLLENSFFRVTLYEFMNGSKRHGYKLWFFNEDRVSFIGDSKALFYTRRNAIEGSRKCLDGMFKMLGSL
ncbi:MAG: hypothetical protein AABX23_01700 [Nanoarchaeota archaeon]